MSTKYDVYDQEEGVCRNAVVIIGKKFNIFKKCNLKYKKIKGFRDRLSCNYVIIKYFFYALFVII